MPTLHLISHTHWDREWYLPFQQFRLKLVALMDKLLDLLAADPEFRYFMLDGQTIVLDDYLAIRPERESEIRAYVQAGRLLVGPWHILPDEFLVSPEATVRNLLQGQRTAARFGRRMEVGYIPDPFGHIGQMPQVLRGFGIETAALRRGLADEPCELIWQAPDGSSVFLAYLRDGYDNAYPYPLSRPEDLEPFFDGVRRLRDSLLPHTATGHVLLMHGTDHMEPQPLTSTALAQAAEKLPGDALVHSTLPHCIAAIREELRRRGAQPPVVEGELRNPRRHHLLPGVLSARMWIKQRNRACETLLERWAEPFSAWASWGPGESPRPAPNPQAFLRHAWRLLMECHPHDSICGCSVDQVHEEMRRRFDQVEQVGEALTGQALGAIAAAVDTTSLPPSPAKGEGEDGGEGGKPWSRAVVVFNPLASRRTDLVETLLELPPAVAEVEVVDEAGMVLPGRAVELLEPPVDHYTLDRAGLERLLARAQDGRIYGGGLVGLDLSREGAVLTIRATLSKAGEPDAALVAQGLARVQEALGDPTVERFELWVSSRLAAVRFVARDVPGHGYRTFWARPRAAGSASPAPSAGPAPLSPHAEKPGPIENEYLALAAAADGTLTLTDKRTGSAFAGLNRFIDGGDCGDEYNYAPPDTDILVQARPVSMHAWSDGVGQYLEMELQMAVPEGLAEDCRQRSAMTLPLRIRTTARLMPGVPRVDITTDVDNPARDHRLRVHFPLPFAATAADYDGHFQVVRRPAALPAHDATWVEDPRPEVPQRAFCDVTNGQVGLLLANRGLPEVAFDSAEVALTLLRCVGWLSRADFSTRRGHAGPATATPGAQEIGRHRFEYALVPHGDDALPAYHQAYAFDVPLRAIDQPAHSGALPAAASFLQVEPAVFILSAVKPAENGPGVIVRGYNITDERIQVILKPLFSFVRATRVRLDETEVEELFLEEDGRVSLEARGHEVVTVRFR